MNNFLGLFPYIFTYDKCAGQVYIYIAPVLGCTQIRGVFHSDISSAAGSEASVSPSAFSKSLQGCWRTRKLWDRRFYTLIKFR